MFLNSISTMGEAIYYELNPSETTNPRSKKLQGLS